MERRDVTIYDVAKAAGVAASTVSRAFSRPGRVSADTAERIRRVAEELGYKSAPLARRVAGERTGLIAMMTANLTNPYYAEIIRGAQEAAIKADHTVLMAQSDESPDTERRSLERLVPLVDGMILVNSRMSDAGVRLIAKQLPTFLINRVVGGVPSLVVDQAAGMRKAVEHLAGLGHTQIGYAGGPEASWANGVRWRTLQDTARELHLRVRSFGPFRPTLHGGLDAAAAWAENPTSALICFNDLLAIGAMKGIVDRGLWIPGDVSVVGFDNSFAAQLSIPGLTTGDAPLRYLGEAAVTSILATLRHPHRPVPQDVRPVVIPMDLKVRHSTGPFRAIPVIPPAARRRA